LDELEVDGAVVRCRVSGAVDALVKTAAGFELVDLESRRPSLEELFLNFYGGEPE
jgi:ABC-2 type transport system ATP-binding protein